MLRLTNESHCLIQMHLQPRFVARLTQTCRRMRAALDDNAEFWGRVAAHLAWSESHPLSFTRLEHLVYIDQGYFAAMNEVVVRIHREVTVRATIGLVDMEEDDDDDDDNPFQFDAEAEKARLIAYWAPFIGASLETTTRAQLWFKILPASSLGFTPGDEELLRTMLIQAEELQTMPMKAIARRLVRERVKRWPKPKRNSMRRLHKWARDFAEAPGMPNHVKNNLMWELRLCILDSLNYTANHDDDAAITLNDVDTALNVLCDFL